MDKKYEQLIEYILNDDTEKARSLFHDIVVGKSREIYENLIDEVDLEQNDGIGGLEDEIEAESIGEDDIDGEEIAVGDEMPADDAMDMPSDDATDDMMGDVTATDGDEIAVDGVEGEAEIEDRVVDLEDALDELKREFEELMGDDADATDGEGAEEIDVDGSDDSEVDATATDDAPASDDASAPAGDDTEFGQPKESLQHTAKLAADFMREYIEKVAAPANTEGQGVANAGKVASVNTKSTVAGKNDMGGSSKNIARGGSNAAPDGTTPPSSDKADKLPGADKFENVPGAKAGKAFSNAKKPVTNEPSGVNKDSIVK